MYQLVTHLCSEGGQLVVLMKTLCVLFGWQDGASSPGLSPTAVLPLGNLASRVDLPGVNSATDGMLFANALHFVRDPAPVLARLAAWLRPGGRAVVVEYDRRRANPWVPYPIWAERLSELVASAGLSAPVIRARRPSAFGGDFYVAAADRLADAGGR